jgi:hypothetical protein
MSLPKDHLDRFPWQRGWLWHHLHNYGDCKKGRFKCMNKGDELHDVPTHYTKFLKYLTPNWGHLQHLVREQFNQGEGPRCILHHGLLLHIHPWLLLWIGVGKNVLQRHHKIESIKRDLWVDTLFPLQQWDELHLRARSWQRCGMPQECVQFDVECDLVWSKSKVETIVGIHSQNFRGESSFKGVQTPSQKDHLQRNSTCLGMLAWRDHIWKFKILV